MTLSNASTWKQLRPRHWAPTDLLLFGTVVAIIESLVGGYRFGVSDHIEQLPIIMRAMDPSYLTNDFFTNAATSFGPRWGYANFLALLASLVPLAMVFFVLHIVANALIAVVTGLFACRLFPNAPLAPFVAIALVMGLSVFGLGGKGGDLSVNLLVPGQLAMPLVFTAIWLGAQGKIFTGVLLCMAAAFLHPLIGLGVGCIMLGATVAGYVASVRRMGSAVSLPRLGLSYGGGVVGLAAITAFWTLPTQGEFRLPTDQFITILAEFRHPHHYIPSSFPIRDWLDTGAFLFAAVSVFFWWWRSIKPSHYMSTFIAALGLITVGLCVGGYLFVEVIPSRIWTTIQAYRFLFILKWCGLILMAGMIAALLEDDRFRSSRHDAYLLLASLGSPVAMALGHVGRFARQLLRKMPEHALLRESTGPWPLLVGVLLTLFVIGTNQIILPAMYIALGATVVYGSNRQGVRGVLVGACGVVILGVVLANTLLPSPPGQFAVHFTLADIEGDHVEVANWAKRHTTNEAVFLTPPHFGQFRLIAERALVVDFKAFPFRDKAMAEWYERIIDVYGESSQGEAGAGRKFDPHYREIDDSRIISAGKRWGATHAVLYEGTETELPVLYLDKAYMVVQISANGDGK